MGPRLDFSKSEVGFGEVVVLVLYVVMGLRKLSQKQIYDLNLNNYISIIHLQ